MVVEQVESDKVYLTEDEIQKLYALKDLSTKEKETRDLFLIACETLISFLEQQQLHPKPTGFNEDSWTASCPSGGNHFIMVTTLKDEWGCGYCRKKGTILDLKKWVKELE